jgi:hypothetical protein
MQTPKAIQKRGLTLAFCFSPAGLAGLEKFLRICTLVGFSVLSVHHYFRLSVRLSLKKRRSLNKRKKSACV